MKTIIGSILVCCVLLVGYGGLATRLPRQWRAGGGAGSQFDQNVMRAESYLYRTTRPEVVIAGSSISARFGRTPPGWYNLSFAGGGAFTALEVLTRAGGEPPAVVLIETNVLTVPTDEKLLGAVFTPGLVAARGRWPALREALEPAHVIVRALPRGAGRPTGVPLDETRFAEQRERRKRELLVRLSDAKLDAITAKMRRYVDALERRGVRVAFFEAPEYAWGDDLPLPTAIRARLRAAFPPDAYAWVPPVDPRDYATTDAVHLTPESAARYARVMTAYVDALRGGGPTSRPADQADPASPPDRSAVVDVTGG